MAARPADPFTTYRFLKALEDSGSVGPGTGWQPYYLQRDHGRPDYRMRSALS